MQPPTPAVDPDRRLGFARPVTVAEAAALLGVSTLAVYRLIHTDELPASRLDGAVRIRQTDLAAYLLARRQCAVMRANVGSSRAQRRPALAAERPALRLVSNRA
ncbi:MAG TPA: helix-turn-helix domain-containing protein [Pseudonocardia sp.]|jgi:excisionase family DNA binding protein|nr:helix-turn-helix domain-containing protein [Pseudonocardia sp.]